MVHEPVKPVSQKNQRRSRTPQKSNCAVYAITTPSVQFNRSPVPIFRRPPKYSPLCAVQSIPYPYFSEDSQFLPMFDVWRTTPVVNRNPNDDDLTEYLVLPQHFSCWEFLEETAVPREKISWSVSEFHKENENAWRFIQIPVQCEPAAPPLLV